MYMKIDVASWELKSQGLKKGPHKGLPESSAIGNHCTMACGHDAVKLHFQQIPTAQSRSAYEAYEHILIHFVSCMNHIPDRPSSWG